MASFNAAAADADAAAETRNWIDFTVGGSFVDGDEGAYRERTQRPTDMFGGITDFHYEMDVGKKGLFEVDGRSVLHSDDYGLTLKLSDPDWGYVRVGFEQYDTYYNGKGGYEPISGAFFALADNELTVQRGKAFFEAALTLENKPEIRFRYSYDYREGNKDSTSWGDITAPGAPGARKILPTLLDLDEDRHTIALDLAHHIGEKTRVGLGGRAEFTDYSNARFETRSGPTRVISHREEIETGLYGVHAFSDTDITERFKVTTAYGFTSFDTDLGGYRFYGTAYDVRDDAIRSGNDHGFLGLGGGSRLHQHVGTISAMWRPTDHVTIVPSVRIEGSDQNGDTSFLDTARTGDENIFNTRSRSFLDISESIEARYTGVTNFVFYARAEALQGDGDLNERETFRDDPTRAEIVRATESERFVQKYTAGMNWYPTRKIAAATQYYFKARDNDYDHVVANTEGLYPGYIMDQDFQTHDANFRVTFRPLSNLSFVTRYDFQLNTFYNQMGNAVAGVLSSVEGAKGTAHIFSESVTWSPTTRMYVQVSGSYTRDRLESPANFIVAAAAPAGQRVQVSENDYITASGTVGYALTEKTDLTASYSYFLADNYDPSIAATSLPYGAGLEEHVASAGVTYRINKNLQLMGRYAYMTSDDELAGGFADFDAHLLTTTLRWRF